MVLVHWQWMFLWLTSTSYSKIFPDIACLRHWIKTTQFHRSFGFVGSGFAVCHWKWMSESKFQMILFHMSLYLRFFPSQQNLFMYDFCSLPIIQIFLAILSKLQTSKVHQFLGLYSFHLECVSLLGCTVPSKLENPQQLVGQKDEWRSSSGSK